MSLTSAARDARRGGAARARLLRLWSLRLPSADEVADTAVVDAALVDPQSFSSRLPATVRGGRWALEGWGVLAVVAVAVFGLLLAAWFGWRGSASMAPAGRATLLASGVSVAASATSSTDRASPSPSVSFVVVDVAGKVRRPGLVRLPVGSRVADALAAAGGVLPRVDLTSINLAALVSDGEQVVVGVVGAVGAGSGLQDPAGQAMAAAGEPLGLDLNAASLEQLETLPGVGPVLAQRIIDWRLAHGHFSDVGELREVGGIGERKFVEIEPKVRV